MDKVHDIKCSMTISNVRDRRVLEAHLRAYAACEEALAENETNNAAYQEKLTALSALVSILSHYCTGEINGRDLSKPLELEDLEDGVIVHLAESVLGYLKEEMGKSESSSLPSLRVGQA
jgi:hypothetical protein